MHPSINAFAQKIFSRFGYELIPQWRLEQFELANHLRDLFRHLDIQCVLDVGANKGQYRDFLREHVGYQGLILSFEPVSELVQHLMTRAAKDKQWRIFPFALGATDTTKAFNVMSTSQFSSFLEPDHSVIGNYRGKNSVDHQETVPVKQLDTFMAELSGKLALKNIYLKLDTQGYDLEVVKGASKTLPTVKAMQSEVSVLGIYSGMPDFLTAIQAFRANHFDITGMFPVTRDAGLRVVEFDCVLVNHGTIQ